MSAKIQYAAWTKVQTDGELRRDAALCAMEAAIPILRDSLIYNQMMARAIFAVQLACYSKDESFKRAIREKIEEIDELVQKGGAA